MDTSKHTPAPWAIHGEFETLRVVRENSEDPNACDGIRQIAEVVQSGYEIPNYDEAQANAKLIAAAPDLLNALQLMAAHYDDLSKSNPGFMGKLCLQDYGLWNRALLAMDRSIAKATAS